MCGRWRRFGLSARFRMLIKQRGRVVSKRSISRRLFGLHANSLNAVEVYVHRLRRRLATAGADVEIRTLHRTGYFVAVRPQSAGRTHALLNLAQDTLVADRLADNNSHLGSFPRFPATVSHGVASPTGPIAPFCEMKYA